MDHSLSFWIIVASLGIVAMIALAFLAIRLVGLGRKRPDTPDTKKPKHDHGSADSHKEPAAPAKEPAHGASHGHDDHHHKKEKDGWGLLKFSVGLLALAGAVALGWHFFDEVGMVNTSPPHGRGVRHLYADRDANTGPAVSLGWNTLTAPPSDTDRSANVEGMPGYNIIWCAPSREDCELADSPAPPDGYRLYCLTMRDTVGDWSKGECQSFKSEWAQSTTGTPLLLQWRYRKR